MVEVILLLSCLSYRTQEECPRTSGELELQHINMQSVYSAALILHSIFKWIMAISNCV